MKEGYRVLCLGYKKINGNPKDISREQAESDLEFAGLLILTSPLKKDTPQYINQLKNAGYHNIMITGDNMYTAAKVGLALRFGPKKHAFLIHENNKFVWSNLDDQKIADKLSEFF